MNVANWFYQKADSAYTRMSSLRIVNCLRQSLVAPEYVETVEQRDLLESLGCTLYQGWLYSPALPLGELEAKLRAVEKQLRA